MTEPSTSEPEPVSYRWNVTAEMLDIDRIARAGTVAAVRAGTIEGLQPKFKLAWGVVGGVVAVLAVAAPGVGIPIVGALVVTFLGILSWNRFGAPRVTARRMRSQPAAVFPFVARADPSGLQIRSPQAEMRVDWSLVKLALLLPGDLDCIALVYRNRTVQGLPNEALHDGGDGVPAAAVERMQHWIDLCAPPPGA